MTRGTKIIRNVAIAIGALLVFAMATVLVTIRTEWFRDFARRQTLAALEDGTGGKAEMGEFLFDASHLRAVVKNLVIHGNEPAAAEPFVRVQQVELDLRIFGPVKGLLGITYLGISRPQVHVIVYPDGRTNVPTPKPSAPSKATALETVADLAAGHFELGNGELNFNEHKVPLDVRANNLRAQLWYRLTGSHYEGQVTLEPVYVVAGRNTPVSIRVAVPVALERDAVRIRGASIATETSRLQIDGALEDLRQPRVTAQVQGRITLADLKNAGGPALAAARGGDPDAIDLAANAEQTGGRIQVKALRVALGQSHVEASGVLKDAQGASPLHFDGALALDELGRLLRVNGPVQGIANINGQAKVGADNRYEITSRLAASGLAFHGAGLQVRDAALSTAARATPGRIEVSGLHLAAFGGDFTGDGSLEDSERYQVTGHLRHLDLQQAVAALAGQQIPYGGAISGSVRAGGNVHANGTQGIEAEARLEITPTGHGMPVRGRLDADYNGARDDLIVRNSSLMLPHTQLTMAGSMLKRLNLTLVTRDVRDLTAMSGGGVPRVGLTSGELSFTGAVSGTLTSPDVTGHVAANHFQVADRQFDRLDADVAVDRSHAEVRNAALTRGAMNARFTAAAELKNWKPLPASRVSADGAVENGDLADILAMAGQPGAESSGKLAATWHVSGTVGNPLGSANVQIVKGSFRGEPFDRVDVQVNLADRTAAIPAASITGGFGRIDLNAELQHPRDSFTTGQIHASVRTSGIDLAKVRTLASQSPAGQVQFSSDVTGELGNRGGQTEFLPASVRADGTAQSLRFQGQPYGNARLQVQTAGKTANLDLTSDFAGSRIRVAGSTQLVSDYPTTATAEVSGLAMERVLALANRQDIPARGTLSAVAHVHGTLQNPEGDATLNVTNAVVYDEPVNRIDAQFSYLAQRADLSHLEIAAGPSRIALSARFDHPVGKLDSGKIQFRVDNGQLDLARLRNVQTQRPGLAGVVQVRGDGSGELRASGSSPLLTSLNANLDVSNLAADGKALGTLALAAHTTGGDSVDFNLKSDLAGSSIEGQGNARLAADYPMDAQLSFRNVAWTRLQPLFGPPPEGMNFEASSDGKVTLSGPILRLDQLRGSLAIARLQVQTLPGPGGGRPVTIENQGPLTATLDRGVVTLDGFHLAGPQTDVRASGTIPLQNQRMNLAVTATANLALLQQFDKEISSSGSVALTANAGGTLSNPAVNGRLELHDATVSATSIPNGISHANGVVMLLGSRATVQNLTAEIGGGKITISGGATYAGLLRFGIGVHAAGVRVRVQEGVSVMANADLRLAGTTASSSATGSVTLEELNYAPHSDLGSILTRAAPPVQSAPNPSALLDNMKLDVRARTSPAMHVQASLAEDVQTDADLRIRGTASRPALLGRISLTEGKLVFFGLIYAINSGTVSFYNPLRIEPILNLSLATQAKGVDVTLNVSGPVDNMQLSYSSDPPLQFQEIVGLLSTGKTPTSDPTLLANQPTPESQSLQQRGETAIVSQALANPVSRQLQRVFGVSQLKIDPSFAGASQLPTAQVTLQQQITPELTFTYVSQLDDPNSMVVRADWALNSRWAAQATRDQNGIVSVRLLYKKQFR